MTDLNLLRDGTTKLIEDGYTLPLINNEGILELINRITELEATIQRVRDLHKSEDNGTKGHYTNEPILECADCVDGQGYPLEYPCPTIKALGEPK